MSSNFTEGISENGDTLIIDNKYVSMESDEWSKSELTSYLEKLEGRIDDEIGSFQAFDEIFDKYFKDPFTDCRDFSYAIDEIIDGYIGQHSSAEEFGRELLAKVFTNLTGDPDDADIVDGYFDFEKYGREGLEDGQYVVTAGGHYFDTECFDY